MKFEILITMIVHVIMNLIVVEWKNETGNVFYLNIVNGLLMACDHFVFCIPFYVQSDNIMTYMY